MSKAKYLPLAYTHGSDRSHGREGVILCTFLVALATLLASCGPPPKGASYRVYVSNEGSGDLTIIDPVKIEALATLPLGKRARAFHPSADGDTSGVAMSVSTRDPTGMEG